MSRYDNKNICELNVFVEIVQRSSSFNEICESLKSQGYDNHTLTAVKKRIASNNIDTSHLKGKAWNKDSFDYSRFVDGSKITSSAAAKGLILKRGNVCESCGNSEWLGYTIMLEVHHKDGDKHNNDEDNLSLLCPNCHALTDNFRGRNSNKHQVSDIEFIEALRTCKNVRQALLKLNLTPKGANYRRAYDLAMVHKIKHILEP